LPRRATAAHDRSDRFGSASATAGLEPQLNDRISVSVRDVHKQIDRAIEDTQTATLDPDGNTTGPTRA
jgi:hypothetical protein